MTDHPVPKSMSDRTALLASEMQDLIVCQARAGISYAVALGGEVIAAGGCGVGDRRTAAPMAPDTIARIFSMTRAITSAAFMTLVDGGVVGLDDPLSRYLPAFATTPVLRTPDAEITDVVAQERPITLHMLLTYTSGLGYTFGYPESAQIRQTDIMGPGHTTAEGIDRLAQLPLFEQPGSRWRYGFSGDVLGRVIEVVSGQSLDVFLQERLLGPLGMGDTGFWLPPEKVVRLAKAYSPVGDDPLGDVNATWQSEYGAFDRPITFLSGGGGLVSSALDYLKFLQMLLDGGQANGRQLLTPASVARMLTGYVPLAPGLAYRPHARFGYGLCVLDPEAERPFGLDTREATWAGLANTTFLIDPQHGLAAVGMAQYFGPDLERFEKAFRTAVYRLIA